MEATGPKAARFIQNVSTAVAGFIIGMYSSNMIAYCHSCLENYYFIYQNIVALDCCTLNPNFLSLNIAFVRGWEMTLVMLSLMPAFLVISAIAAQMTRKLKVQDNAAYARKLPIGSGAVQHV